MKLGFENKRMVGVMVVILVVALYVIANWLMGGSGVVPGAGGATVATAGTTPTKVPRKPIRRLSDQAYIKPSNSQDPTLRADLIEVTEKTNYTGAGRMIFVDPKKFKRYVAGSDKKTEPIPVPTPAEKPGPPPIPLKFYGYSSEANGPKKVFFTDPDGQDIFIGQEGDLINKRFKIVKINKNSVEVLDVINNNKQNLPLTTG